MLAGVGKNGNKAEMVGTKRVQKGGHFERPAQLHNLKEAMTSFLVKCELVDSLFIIAGNRPALMKTAKNVFLPEIIYSESESELTDLTAAIVLLSKGLDLVLADGIIKI